MRVCVVCAFALCAVVAAAPQLQELDREKDMNVKKPDGKWRTSGNLLAPPEVLQQLTPSDQDTCQRRPLNVSFAELGWDDWIITPSSYDAGYCAGSCAPTKGDTNHAIIQSLSHMHNQAVPAPCCAPTKLSSVSVLYLDEKTNIVLKTYKDMKVETCGCR